MNISGIRPYHGFYDNKITEAHPQLHSLQEQGKQNTVAAKDAQAESGVVYESKRPEALNRALSEMKEDRVLQQYQYFAKGLSSYDPSLAVISGENFNL